MTQEFAPSAQRERFLAGRGAFLTGGGGGATRCWLRVSSTSSRKKWNFRLPGNRLAGSRPSAAMSSTVRGLRSSSSATWAVVRMGGYCSRIRAKPSSFGAPATRLSLASASLNGSYIILNAETGRRPLSYEVMVILPEAAMGASRDAEPDVMTWLGGASPLAA
jgi:hypothetical protein